MGYKTKEDIRNTGITNRPTPHLVISEERGESVCVGGGDGLVKGGDGGDRVI